MISKEQIKRAKHADLPSVLFSLGIVLIPDGLGYYHRDHDSLKLFQKDNVWLYKWWSRGGEVGDGIDYLKRYYGMNFREAVQMLSGNSICENKKQQHNYQKNEVKIWKSEQWQLASKKLVRTAQKFLFEPNGKEKVLYLQDERGLRIETIRRHRLGSLPAKAHMPSKIVIPCYDSKGKLIRIRFRIDDPGPGQARYRISQGSNPNLPLPLGISAGRPVIIVESELDAILISQEVGGKIGVLGLGTVGIKFTQHMIRYLNDQMPKVLISMDQDRSGRQKATFLAKELSNAINWPVPKKYGKDPGDAWKHMDINKWIMTGLSQHF
jgi:DNA primase